MAVRAAYAAGFEAEAKTPDGMMESRAFRSRRERQETSRLRLLPAASPPEAPIEAPPGAGLVHAYLIDTDPARRAQVHKQLSGRSNMVVRAYRDAMVRYYDEPPTPQSLAGFIGARYAITVLQGLDTAPIRQNVLAACQRRSPLDLGGFQVRFDGGKRSGHYVTQSMLSPDGRVVG